LPDYAKCSNFINADLIAQGLSLFSPQQVAIKSGKLVLGEKGGRPLFYAWRFLAAWVQL
jgi:hypothetical protein